MFAGRRGSIIGGRSESSGLGEFLETGIALAFCPQCGGLLRPSADTEIFPCPWCGSTLLPGTGVRILVVREESRVDANGAEAAFRAWLDGSEHPRRSAGRVSWEVGPQARAPFLRLDGAGTEQAVPLVPVASPDVTLLPAIPAALVAADDPERVMHTLDPAIAREAFRRAAATAELRQVRVEERAYYPVRYRRDGAAYSAIVDASRGGVWATRLPPRPGSPDRTLALSVSALLFSEAWLVPGLPAKLGVVVVTALGLRPLLPRLLDRYA